MAIALIYGEPLGPLWEQLLGRYLTPDIESFNQQPYSFCEASISSLAGYPYVMVSICLVQVVALFGDMRGVE